MDYRQLGNTGEKISEIGFGTWQLGGISWVSPDESTCCNLLHSAFDMGINLYDVSPSYGHGRSETLVGKAFEGKREKVFISGKIGVLEDGTYHGLWSRRELRESMEQSLRRLRTDYFDFLALHTPPMDVLKSGYVMDFLHSLKQEGVARFVGVSLEAQPEEALIALDHGIDILQIRFNLLFPEAQRILPIVTRKGTGLIINSPFAHGYLTGRYISYGDINEGDYPKGRFRATKPQELVERMIGNANAFRRLIGESAFSMTHASLKFILAHKAVSSTVPGHRSLKELEDNVAAANSSFFSEHELEQSREIYQVQVLRQNGILLTSCEQNDDL